MENTNDFIPKGEVDINKRDINRANLSGNDADRNIGDLYSRDQIRLIWEYLQRKPLVPVSTPSGQQYIELTKFKSGTASVIILDNSDLPVASIQVSSAARGGAGAIVNYGCSSAPKILEVSRNDTDIYVKVDFTSTSKLYYSFEGVQSKMEKGKPELHIVQTAINNNVESYTITNLGGTVIFGKTQGDFVLGDITPTSVTTNNINITNLPSVILGTDSEGNVVAKKPPVYKPEVEETVTLEPKDNAVVELKTDDSNYTATYTFKIPRGEKGEPGDVSQVIKDDVTSIESTWSSEKISKYVENLKSKNFTFVVDSEETLKLWTADSPDPTYDFTSVLIRRTLPTYTFDKPFDLSKPKTKYIYAETDTKLIFNGAFGFKGYKTEAENLHVETQGVAFNDFTQLLNCSAEAKTACTNCSNISNFKASTSDEAAQLFVSCTNLTDIYVKPLHNNFTAFYSCSNLTNVSFDETSNLTGTSFNNCNNISNSSTIFTPISCSNFVNLNSRTSTSKFTTTKAEIQNAKIAFEQVGTEQVSDLTAVKSSLGEATANNLTAVNKIEGQTVASKQERELTMDDLWWVPEGETLKPIRETSLTKEGLTFKESLLEYKGAKDEFNFIEKPAYRLETIIDEPYDVDTVPAISDLSVVSPPDSVETNSITTGDLTSTFLNSDQATIQQGFIDDVNSTSISTQTINTVQDATVGGTLHVKGDIIQDGASKKTHVEDVYTKQQTIHLREGASTPMNDSDYSGLITENYDLDGHSGFLGFNREGEARVGDYDLGADGQKILDATVPLCARDELPKLSSDAITYFDKESNILKTEYKPSGIVSLSPLKIDPLNPEQRVEALKVDGIRGLNSSTIEGKEFIDLIDDETGESLGKFKSYPISLQNGANGPIKLGHFGKFEISPGGGRYTGTAKNAENLKLSNGGFLNPSLSTTTSAIDIAVVEGAGGKNPELKVCSSDNVVVGKAKSLDFSGTITVTQDELSFEMLKNLQNTSKDDGFILSFTPLNTEYIFEPILVDCTMNTTRGTIVTTLTFSSGLYIGGISYPAPITRTGHPSAYINSKANLKPAFRKTSLRGTLVNL